MKKHLFSLLVALVATAGSLPMAAQEAYAVLTEADYTLTFYYDNLRSTRPGTEYDMPTTGATPGWAGCQKIKHAVFDASFADYRPTSTSLWFQNCVKLQDIKDIRNLNTENVIDMSLMFQYCSSLASLDLTGFNTANVTDMSLMFIGCSSLASLDLTGFNTANVTTMEDMFNRCSSLVSLNLTSFNTEKVTNMWAMFNECSSLASLDLSSFNTENVTTMQSMFWECSSLASLDLSSFNTEKVTDMREMFGYCMSLTSLDLTGFNTANVTDMTIMFRGSSSLTTIYCNDDWSVGGKVDYYRGMFSNCPNLKGDGAAYDSSKTGIEMANPTTGYFTTMTTGIDHVTAAGKVGDGKTYDLSGRLVSKNYKGVVVTNGRKILQR